MTLLELPATWVQSPWALRLRVAIETVTSAGAALNELRGSQVRAQEVGAQLKTAVDLAAEGWVLGLLGGSFPEDRLLAEERHAATATWHASELPFWTVDALDGTRSYIEGYAGYGVQVAFVEAGRPIFGVVAEPARGRCYAALEGVGAYEFVGKGTPRRLQSRQSTVWPPRPRFVDSVLPAGVVGEMFREHSGHFVECGSIGLKACRVASDEADVFVKELRFRIWDVAPVEVILAETGCGLRLWDGQRIDYSGNVIEFSNLVAAPNSMLEPLIERLSFR